MYYAFDRRWLRSTVTVALVAMNVVLYLAVALTKDTLYVSHEYNRLVSAMFLHESLSHLFGNMILLFYIGAVVERNLGHILYTILYLGSGIVGNVMTVFYEVTHREHWVSLGASGAVFGVMGAMLVLLLLTPKEKRFGSSLLPRIVFMVAYSLYTGLRSTAVNNIAHIAGLLCGAILGFLFIAPRKNIDLDALL